jgi:transglutaminase-like putative cysteine protease
MNARRPTPAFTRGDQERFVIDAPQTRLIMQIRVGYELIFECPQPTPMLLTLNTHFSRVADIVAPDHITTSPSVPITPYRDKFGNLCSRIVAPAGEIRISTDAVLNDSGLPDPIEPNAWQHPVQDLPDETLVFLLGSRYCDTDRMTEIAWGLFDKAPIGWGRVQAICDFVHNHIVFGYEHARSTRTAMEAFQEQRGVCRDYTHLAITFCWARRRA